VSDDELGLEELASALTRERTFTVIDVREADEVAEAHLEASTHVPLAELERDPRAALAARGLTQEHELVTFCAAGGRAARAREKLREAGFSKVRAARPGMQAWVAKGLPHAGRSLTDDPLARYARQMRLPEVGRRGQETLAGAHVLVVGAGGLGCPVLLYLASQGVGTLTVVDPDVVSRDNLHRQILYSDADVGRLKVDAACELLRAKNPGLTAHPIASRVDASNVEDLARGAHVLVDASDNYAARAAVNLASCKLEVPAVFGAVSRFEGEVTTRVPGKGPCYACLHPSPPVPGIAPTCAEEGVLGAVPGVVGLLQANEVTKLLLGFGEPLVGTLLHVDLRSMRFFRLGYDENPSCHVCGELAR
jgi:molybdopterin/thiamine biosynthesis adenylyltransferase